MDRRDNYNEAITRLPVLVFARGSGSDGWVTVSVSVTVHGEVLKAPKRYPVRVVPADALLRFANPRTRAKFEADFGRIPEDFSRRLLSMLGIADAAEKHDLGKIAKLAQRAAAATGRLSPAWEKLNTLVSPWDKVAATLNTGLYGIFLVLWQKESQLVPALLCRTPAQALFAHALFKVGGRHGLAVCRREKCGNVFFASRDEQFYCSTRCRVAEAMKRYRKRPKYLKRQTRGRRTER